MTNPIDLTIVLLYVAGTTLLGVRLGRRQRDVQSYFVGDRDVSWWLVLASIVATETSTVTFLSVPGLAFNPSGGDLAFLQLAMGYVVGRCVIAWLLLPQYFGGRWLTAYQLLRQRFSPAVQRTASALFLGTRTVADGLRLFLTALLLEQFTGWGMAASILAVGAVTLVYTYLGGMRAVIWTDLIQFGVYMLGAAVAAVLILDLIPGGFAQFVSAGSASEKFRVFDFSAAPDKTLTFWAGLIGGAFVTMATHGADQLMVQRYLCARSLGEARLALVSSGVVVFAQFLLFLLIGVGLYVLHQTGELAVPAGTANDAAFGLFIREAIPVGLKGLVIAAVLAAAMSTLSSSLNSSANAVVTDFYRPIVSERPERHYLWVSRGLTLFWGVAQVGVALLAVAIDSPRSVIDQVLAVASFTTGIVLGLFALGSLPRPVSSRAALVGLVAGFAAVTAVWLPSLFGSVLLAWPWYAPVGTLTTVFAALIAEGIFSLT